MAGETDSGIDHGREAILRALREGGVRFVLIGGAALESHQQPHRTEDVDITPDRTHENLEKLAKVLNGLECRLEIDPTDAKRAVALPSDYFTAASLARVTVWNLRTAHGKLDLAVTPAGFPNGYEQLAPKAQTARVFATRVEVSIASLEDVEHSKRTAARPKDRRYLARVGRLDPPQKTHETVNRDRTYGYEDEIEPPSR